MRTMRLMLGCVLALVCGTASSDDQKNPPIDGTALVGSWEEVSGKEENRGKVEFTKDSKVTLSIPFAKGKYADLVGTYSLTGNKLKLKLKGASNVAEWTITKLSDDVMETQVGKARNTYQRVKSK